MRNILKKVTLTALCALSLAGCASKETIIKFDSQLDAVTQLNNGTVDCAIIDSVMAGYYTKEGDFAENIAIVDNLVLSQEEYAIAGRKNDKTLMDKINEALVMTYANGNMGFIANYFGVSKSLAINESTTYQASQSTDDSFTKVVNSGKLIIGYTVFAPIAYTDSKENYSGDEFTGFDTELARAVVATINSNYNANISIEFKEIDWDSKEALLSNGTIDLIWNGLTVTEERKENMTMSLSYLYNNQVAVVRKADLTKYSTKEALKAATIGVESGSAGEDCANELKNN